MKHLIIASLLLLSARAGYAQAPQIEQYWLVILKTGPRDKEIKDTTERKKIFDGHFANILPGVGYSSSTAKQKRKLKIM